jgi:hypothetical protein
MEWEHESDDSVGTYQDADTDQTEVDAMLDSLMEGVDEDLSERKSGRNARGRNGQQRRGVPTAKGGSVYRAPGTQNGYVTQQQFKEALARVGEENRRNAEGIKTVNARFGKLDGQVTDLVTVTQSQSKRIGSLDTRMKLDSALDFASAFTLESNGTTTALTPNFGQLLRGAVKGGMIGNSKGAMSSPWAIGALGVVLSNPGILGNILTPRT